MNALAGRVDVLIVGAGAAGLMAAWELRKAGKTVAVLEARNRTGGRIFPLEEEKFGYPAQGGAEFVHGDAPLTKALLKKAGLTLVSMKGDAWSTRSGSLKKSVGGATNNPIFIAHKDEIYQKLQGLTTDISIKEFLESYFAEERYAVLRHWILMLVEGYDAADPEKMSTFALRDDWLGGEEWQQMRIKEGYGALISFLEGECLRAGVSIFLNTEVLAIRSENGGVSIECRDRSVFKSDRVIVTAPLPVLKRIEFPPLFATKLEVLRDIGFGRVIKVLLLFKEEWWLSIKEHDFSHMMFFSTDDHVRSWWTQYPEHVPTLIAWIPGVEAEKLEAKTDEEILAVVSDSLARAFKADKVLLEKQLVHSAVVNWPADPFTQGAYSYPTPQTEDAVRILSTPFEQKVFLAGEALYSGEERATVEGALASGKETAERILNL